VGDSHPGFRPHLVIRPSVANLKTALSAQMHSTVSIQMISNARDGRWRDESAIAVEETVRIVTNGKLVARHA